MRGDTEVNKQIAKKNGYVHPLDTVSGMEWAEDVDHADPLIAEPGHLLRLYNSAPTPEAAAFIAGIIDMRLAISIVTGIEFKLPKNAYKRPLDGKDIQDWVDEVDQIDPIIAPRSDLIYLQEKAPTPEGAAFIAGIIDMRQMISFVTETEF